MADIKDKDYVIKQLAEEFGVTGEAQLVDSSKMIQMLARSQELYQEKADYDKANK